MAPSSKENEVLTVAPEPAGTAASTTDSRLEDTASKPHPVALEVPVTVNGARAVEGSDKREPFSETTKTVLVFGNGAVIRLGSPVAPGQLLFLTNEKTKKEVVCQVVKSKNYRNVSGYVELEFTESVVGFWGMRFPSDRITAAQPPAPISVAPKVATPSGSSAPKIYGVGQSPSHSSVPPIVQARPTDPATVVPSPASLVVPSTHDPVASAPPTAKIPEIPAILASSISTTLASSVGNLLRAPEALPGSNSSKQSTPTSSESKPGPIAGTAEDSSETLRLQTARLQEQLSSLLFNSAPAAKSAPPAPAPVPVPDSHPMAQVAAKVHEAAKADTVPVKIAPPAKPLPAPIKSSLDLEEVKIPSWLEPLARNAAASASKPEFVEQEKSNQAPEIVTDEEHLAPPVSTAETESAPDVELPAIGGLFSMDETSTKHDTSSGGSRKGVLFGAIAAGLLLVAGGGWYLYHPTNAARGASAPAPSLANTPTGAPAATQAISPAAPQNAVAPPELSSHSNEAARSSAANSNERPPQSLNSAERVPVTREETRGSAATIRAAETERISSPAPQPEIKKPALGEVHLAGPTVSRSESAQQAEQVVAPAISTSGTDANPDEMASGLAAGSEKPPAAPEVPIPVGGDVKAARLLKEVAPIYPVMARNQHVSGDVVIDALIDANGRVTTMKVISGPALLHQAAKDALKQWKYQPASLDGKPVSMHLTVTLQFRMP
jgi:TonB family protein